MRTLTLAASAADKAAITHALANARHQDGTPGNVREAARVLGLSYRTLWRRIEEYGIDLEAIRRRSA